MEKITNLGNQNNKSRILTFILIILTLVPALCLLGLFNKTVSQIFNFYTTFLLFFFISGYWNIPVIIRLFILIGITYFSFEYFKKLKIKHIWIYSIWVFYLVIALFNFIFIIVL